MCAWVATIAIAVNPCFASAASMRPTSSPGSTTTACFVRSSPRITQLHSKSPTGKCSTIIRLRAFVKGAPRPPCKSVPAAMKTTLIRDNRDATARVLDARILAHIGGMRDEDAYDRLALEVYAYQFERNAPYRRYCERMGSDPSRASSWRDVPAVPAASFADVRLACFGPDRTALTFVSSGTSSAGARASHHELDAAELYDASLLTQYRSLVMPDVSALPHVFLAPPYAEAPRSSLSYMLSAIDGRFGALGGGFFVHNDALDFSAACDALSAGMPSVVFGTAFAFVHFADRCRAERRRLALPPGSRLVETGGFKGKSREVARGDLYRSFEEFFGVPPAFCVSEYGMCELSSQWYDANLADRFDGRDP